MSPLKTLAVVCLILSFSACSTKVGIPIPLQVSDELRTLCPDDLPKLKAAMGQDMRVPLLQNRAETQLIYDQCRSRHRNLLRAVGVEPGPVETSKEANRWELFQDALKSVPPLQGNAK